VQILRVLYVCDVEFIRVRLWAHGKLPSSRHATSKRQIHPGKTLGKLPSSRHATSERQIPGVLTKSNII